MKKNLIIIALITSFISCSGTTQKIKDGATTAKDTFIECAKADIGRTLPEIGLTILAHVTQILMAGEGNYLAKLDEIGTEYGNDTEACAVKAVNTVLSGGTSGPIHTMSPALARSATVISSKGWKFKAE